MTKSKTLDKLNEIYRCGCMGVCGHVHGFSPPLQHVTLGQCMAVARQQAHLPDMHAM